MTAVARTDTSLLGRWWWTVDRWTLAALATLIAFGAVMALAASPPVATRIGLDPFYFVRRHAIMVPVALAILVAVSLQSPLRVRRLAVFCFIGAVALSAAVLVVGVEIKGARRWINLAGFSLQPSEFLKPTFAVVAAWMFAEHRLRDDFPGNVIAIGLLLAVVAVLLSQPDVGMTMVRSEETRLNSSHRL